MLRMRSLPLRTEAFEVPIGGDPDELLPQASAALRRVDGEDEGNACDAVALLFERRFDEDS